MDYKLLSKPFFVLAPMDDVTDTVFRRVVADLASPDMYFTEFVNVDGLQSPGRPNLIKKLQHTGAETRLVAQLWGKNPENFHKTAAELADPESELNTMAGGSFAGVDLNMGCPAKAEVQNGTCSALIKNRPLAHEIISATKTGLAAGQPESAGRLPLSVKTRVGFNEVDMSWIEFLLQHDLDMLTVHGRTRKQMSKVPADWSLIGRAREIRDRLNVATLIVGNGDVRNRQHGRELAEQYGLDGVMIGRGIFTNPFCFDEDPESRWQALSREQRLSLYAHHVELFAETWQHGQRPIHVLNKFCKIYVSGFDGAKELREQLMAAHDAPTLLKILADARA